MDSIECRYRRGENTRHERPTSYSNDRGFPINSAFDGRIEASQQNLGSGSYRGPEDCWFLSSLNAIARTRAGAELIRNSLHYFKDPRTGRDKITVELQGVGLKWTFDREYLRAQDDLSQGDPDVKAFEIAARSYRREMLKNRSGWSGAGMTNRHNFRSEVGGGSIGNPLSQSKFTDEGLFYLAGNRTIRNYSEISSGDYTEENGFDHDKRAVDAMLNRVTNNPDRYAATVSFSRYVDGVPEKHECTVVSADDKTVRLINPNDSSKIVTVSRSKFMESVHLMSMIDMESRQY